MTEQEESDDEEQSLLLTRRGLLAGTAFGVGTGVGAGAMYLLTGGSHLADDSTAQANGDIPDDHVPFSVWEEVRESLRTSPDHLPGRAAALVETGNLEAIFEFVRDEIITVPTSIDGTSETESGIRWGARGTLRCGMGTPRDKADLLADLYQQAGYAATVRAADDGFDEEDARDHYTQRIERVFDPEVDEEQVDDWLARLGADGSEQGEFTVVDDDGEESGAIADRVLEAIGDPMESRGGPGAFSWEWGSRAQGTPIVEVPIGGRPRYANLFADVPFGEAGGEVSDIRARDDPETVRVSLSAVTPRRLDDPIELVANEWSLPDLLGRQLLVQTPTVVAPYEQPTATIGDVDTFTPALALQGLDLTQEEASEGSAFGDPFSLRGDRLSATDGGVISQNGEPLVFPNSGIEPADVESLEVTADPVDYPTIRLEVTALDGDGKHVEGLSASAFSVTDEEEDVMATMTEASAKAHVMFIRDDSGSMGRGVDAATDDEWFDNLRSVIADHESNTVIEYREADSDMWTHLADAVADGPDLIVYAHDGQETDEYLSAMDELLVEAPPTVLLSAYDETSPVEDETVLAQAELTGATTAPMGEWETVREAVVGALDELSLPTYRFDYHVPDAEVGERTAAVTVGENRAASATYEPRARNPIPRALVGLYLTIETGGNEVTRTLGGWDPILDPEWDPYRDNPSTELTSDELGDAQRHALDVHSALLGGVTISFEGDGVPFAVALDDVLGARGTFAEMDLAAVNGTHEDLESALEQGSVTLPHELLLAQAPLAEAATEQGVTFFEHARIALAQQKPLLGTDSLEQSIDVLPLANAATTNDDPRERFATTLERTARIAIAEAAAYEVSTASLLDGIPLVEGSEFDADYDHRASYNDLARRAGFDGRNHELLPADGSVFAYWNVDARTGTLTGVIDDGTGGGRRYQEIEERLDRLSQVMSAYNLLLMAAAGGGAISGLGATSLGIVALYGQQLARMYAGVTLTLMTMDARHLEPQLRLAIAGMVCGLVWQITLGIFSVFSAAAKFRVGVFNLFDNMLGAAGVSTPTSCGI